MARRATILERFRREDVPVLTLVGANEFSPDTEPSEEGETASPELVRTVYDALHVDCGVLSSAAAAWFGPSRPARFLECAEKPVIRRLDVGGVSVAVIFFPPLPAGKTLPDSSLLASVLAAADSVPETSLRIGISPWGFEGEFAVREALEQRYPILLGGGPGASFAGEVTPQAGLFWSRSEKKGRSLMAIDILALPEPGKPVAWDWGLSIQAREIRLTSVIPADPHLDQLIPASVH